MKARQTRIVGWIVLWATMPVLAADSNSPLPYMGQEPPGLTPKVFAPGMICLPNRGEGNICFTKDGRECYFDVSSPAGQIMVTRYEGGLWTTPVKAPYLDSLTSCPSLADNDQSLYFLRDSTIYRVHRSPAGSGIQEWSSPETLPAPVNINPSGLNGSASCHISSLGNMWMCSWRPGGRGACDLYRIRSSEGQFTDAQNQLDLNSNSYDCAAVPGPNEEYVVLMSGRPGGFGAVDLYVSFADGLGGWATPRNLGPTFNTSGSEDSPCLSPDYRYLFFSRANSAGERNIYWVSVTAFLPDPNGPIGNLSTGVRFTSLQAAINYAQSGDIIEVSPGTYKETITLPNIPLTIRSTNPQDSAVVSLTRLVGDGSTAVVTLSAGTALRSLQGLTITGGADGIVCAGAELNLSACVITGNRDCGVEVSNESTLSLDHCIIAGNGGTGLSSLPVKGRRLVYSTVDLAHGTITQNRGYALDGDGITVSNSILSGNGVSVNNAQIKGNVTVSYSDVQGGFTGQGNVDADPLFVTSGTWTDPNAYVLGDCHLKSKAGHWNPQTASWVLDDVTSPCIDAGDLNAVFTLEPAPNGGRVNQGAYGDTGEASRTPAE